MVPVNPANDPFDEPLQANSGNPSGQIDVSQIIQQLFVLGQEIEGLKAAQARNDSEVDHLQVEVYKPRHWYRDPSVLIAMFALFLSLLTTGYGVLR